MRFTRLVVLLFFPIHAFAQNFEEITAISLTEHPMSLRGAAMGGVSDDDVSLNPSSLGALQQATFSASATRVEYDLSLSFLEQRSRDGIALSHVAAAMPLGEQFAIAAYYRSEPEMSGSRGIRPAGTEPYRPRLSCTPELCEPSSIAFGESIFERRERRYGLSGAWNAGSFTFGAGAELQELDEAATYYRITGQEAELAVERSRGREIVANAGIRWQPSRRLALAAAYNAGGGFSSTTEACNLSYVFPPECASAYALTDRRTNQRPDAMRASVAFSPLEALTVTAEAVRRNYSSAGPAWNDVTELHAGAEMRVGAFAVRAGWWRDPRRTDVALPMMFDDQDHVTFGAGFDVAGGARVDVAVDHADAPALRRVSAGITFAGPVR
jgi:hypothetical protein